MPIEIYRSNYTSPKRAKAKGKLALGQAAAAAAKVAVAAIKESRQNEGHIERLLEDSKALAEQKGYEALGFEGPQAAKDWQENIEARVKLEGRTAEEAEALILGAWKERRTKVARKMIAGTQKTQGNLPSGTGTQQEQGGDPVLKALEGTGKQQRGQEGQPGIPPGAVSFGQSQGPVASIPASTEGPTFDYMEEIRGVAPEYEDYFARKQQQVANGTLDADKFNAEYDSIMRKRIEENRGKSAKVEEIAGQQKASDIDREDRQAHEIMVEKIRAASRAQGVAAKANTPQKDAIAWIKQAQKNEEMITKISTININDVAAQQMLKSLGVDNPNDPASKTERIKELQRKTAAYYREAERIQPGLKNAGVGRLGLNL